MSSYKKKKGKCVWALRVNLSTAWRGRPLCLRSEYSGSCWAQRSTQVFSDVLVFRVSSSFLMVGLWDDLLTPWDVLMCHTTVGQVLDRSLGEGDFWMVEACKNKKEKTCWGFKTSINQFRITTITREESLKREVATGNVNYLSPPWHSS